MSAADRCLAEWQGVNDPPCHPSDEGWKPCRLCEHQVNSAEWFMARAQESKEKLAELAKVLPGCFEADGSAVVASAHFPRLQGDPAPCRIGCTRDARTCNATNGMEAGEPCCCPCHRLVR